MLKSLYAIYGLEVLTIKLLKILLLSDKIITKIIKS